MMNAVGIGTPRLLGPRVYPIDLRFSSTGNIPERQMYMTDLLSRRTGASVPAFEEYADVLFERYYNEFIQPNRGQRAFLDLTCDQRKALKSLCTLKQQLCPPGPNQIDQEAFETIEALGITGITSTQLHRLLTLPTFSETEHRQALFIMKMPYIPSREFMDFAIEKQRNRQAVQLENPDLSYEGRKAVSKPLETAYARYMFGGYTQNG